MPPQHHYRLETFVADRQPMCYGQNMSDAAPIPYACPQCAGKVEVTPAAGAQLVTCPHCAAGFVVAGADGSTELPEEESPETRADTGEAELDGLRIRQLAAGRRAAYRSRSYLVIGAVVCFVAAVQLLYDTVRHVRGDGWGLRPTGYVVAAVAALMAASWCVRRAVEMHREARRSSLEEPATPPDFSTLDDGSKHWKNLEDL